MEYLGPIQREWVDTMKEANHHLADPMGLITIIALEHFSILTAAEAKVKIGEILCGEIISPNTISLHLNLTGLKNAYGDFEHNEAGIPIPGNIVEIVEWGGSDWKAVALFIEEHHNLFFTKKL